MPRVRYENDKPIYACSICGREHGANVLMAESCEKTHDIVYIKAKPADIKRLVQYLLTTEGNKELLTKELMDELFKVAKKL